MLYFAVKRNVRGAVIVGTCVVSHWFLDAVVHRPDLPLFPNGPYVGLGLWNSLLATVTVECGLLALGLTLYVRATRARDRIGIYALWSLVAVLLLGWVGSVFGPPPPNERVLAVSALAMWVTVPWAAWADHHRELAV